MSDELAAALQRAHRKMAADIGADASADLAVEVEEDGGHGATVIPRAPATLSISPEIEDALSDPDHPDFDDAAAAVAHALAHLVGAGPAFDEMGDALLEEALAEIIGQASLDHVTRALAGDAIEAEPLVEPAADAYDLQAARPVAALVAVERFARLAAWLAGLEDDGDAETLTEAAVKLAREIKPLAAPERIKRLAERAVADVEDAADDAAETFADYLRGYFKQLQPSPFGYGALDTALDFAASGSEGERPSPQRIEREAWAKEQIQAEAVTLAPGSDSRPIDRLLLSLSDEIGAAVRRSLDFRSLLWSARLAARPAA